MCCLVHLIDEPCMVDMTFLPPPQIVHKLFVGAKIMNARLMQGSFYQEENKHEKTTAGLSKIKENV